MYTPICHCHSPEPMPRATTMKMTSHSAMDATFVRELSAALREFDVLEPWLTEGHWDEHYWDDVAATVADAVGPQPSRTQVVTALRTALSALFGELVSDNGLFRDDLDRRLDLIAGRVRA
jgi:hypothetical protein